MKIRPQYTVTPLKMEIWPMDKWSRKLISECLEKHLIRVDQVYTSMGEPAFKFKDNKDFEKAYQLIKEIEIEQ